MADNASLAMRLPSRLGFRLRPNTLRLAGPITRASQVLRREGARRAAAAQVEPLGRVQADVMDGLLAARAGAPPTPSASGIGGGHAAPAIRAGSAPGTTIFPDATGLFVRARNPSLAARALCGALSGVTEGSSKLPCIAWKPSGTQARQASRSGQPARQYRSSETATRRRAASTGIIQPRSLPGVPVQARIRPGTARNRTAAPRADIRGGGGWLMHEKRPDGAELLRLPESGEIPNNPRLPVLLHRGATPPGDPAAAEALLAAHGWRPA
jgi:hypothetical protein